MNELSSCRYDWPNSKWYSKSFCSQWPGVEPNLESIRLMGQVILAHLPILADRQVARCLSSRTLLHYSTSPLVGLRNNYCNQRVCMFVCLFLRWHISKNVGPKTNFTKFSLRVTGGRDSVCFEGSAICYVLPVLWMTLCFHKMWPTG